MDWQILPVYYNYTLTVDQVKLNVWPILLQREGGVMIKPVQRASLDRRIFLIAAMILMSGIPVLPQNTLQKNNSETGGPTFSVDVEVVNASVSVRDKKGTFIKDLTKDDFTLKEDGRKQTISNFFREDNLPLTIGLIIDASPSMGSVMGQLQLAARIFLKKIIRPDKDRVFIMKFKDIMDARMSFEGQIDVVQGLTSSSEKIDKAATLIGGDGISEKVIPAQFQTMLADSIFMGVNNMPPQGRKALIVIGDGFHMDDHRDWAIAAAQEADALIYTIHIYDPEWGGTNSMGNMFGGTLGRMGSMRGPALGGFDPNESSNDLKTLSRKTGGAFFEGGEDTNLLQIFAQIEEELRSIYSLGYTPIKSTNKGFRKIKVEVKKPGMTVIAREGYIPRTKQ
jgi:VWFA-related protein